MRTATIEAPVALACGDDPDRWFEPPYYEEAKAACKGCPILGECREIGWRAEFGVFGGLDENDRHRIDSKRFAREAKTRRLCSIQGCKEPHDANGMCAKHWQRQYVHGDPLHVPFSGALKNSLTCIFPGCKRAYAAKGYCKRHYYRFESSNGDALGRKDHVSRSDEQHAEIHRLLNVAIDAWRKTESANDECVQGIEVALKYANSVLTRGELDAIYGMGVRLTVDLDRMSQHQGAKTEEARMRYDAIIQMIALGGSRHEVARQLGVSTRTVDRAMRHLTTGIRPRRVPEYQVQK